MSYNLKPFNIENMKKYSSNFIIGTQSTGKSFLVKDIIYHNKKMDDCIIVSETNKNNNFYSSMINPLYIYNDYTNELIDNILKRQEHLYDTQKNKSLLVAIDDSYFIKNDNNKHAHLYVNSNINKLCSIVTSTQPLEYDLIIRSNIDYIFIFKNYMHNYKKRIYELYGSIFSSFEIFNDILQNYTNDHTCLVIDNTNKTFNMCDRVFYYKAESHNTFKFYSKYGTMNLFKSTDEYESDDNESTIQYESYESDESTVQYSSDDDKSDEMSIYYDTDDISSIYDELENKSKINYIINNKYNEQYIKYKETSNNLFIYKKDEKYINDLINELNIKNNVDTNNITFSKTIMQDLNFINDLPNMNYINSQQCKLFIRKRSTVLPENILNNLTSQNINISQQTTKKYSQQFDINTLKNNNPSIIISGDKTNRTKLLKKMITIIDEPNTHIISDNNYYKQITNKYYDTYDEYKLNDILSLKEERLLVIDDDKIIPPMLKSSTIKDLFFNGRHYQMSHILSTNQTLYIPPELRNNVDYVFLQTSKDYNINIKLYKDFGQLFKTFDDFNELLPSVYSDDIWIVINNIDCKVYSYKLLSPLNENNQISNLASMIPPKLRINLYDAFSQTIEDIDNDNIDSESDVSEDMTLSDLTNLNKVHLSPTLKIKQFNLTSLKENPQIFICGKPNKGKSWLTRDILFNIKDIPKVTVITLSEVHDWFGVKRNGFYGDFVSESSIYGTYENSIIDKVLERQNEMLDKDKSSDMRQIVVMDDCLYNISELYSNSKLKNLIYNGRHNSISSIITAQYLFKLSPKLIYPFDYVFLFREDIKNNINKLYEQYGGMFESYDKFEQVFRQLTVNYGCMVINNTVKSTSIEDTIFWYKAKETDSFFIGEKKTSTDDLLLDEYDFIDDELDVE
jgi:hypothetical protein